MGAAIALGGDRRHDHVPLDVNEIVLGSSVRPRRTFALRPEVFMVWCQRTISRLVFINVSAPNRLTALETILPAQCDALAPAIPEPMSVISTGLTTRGWSR